MSLDLFGEQIKTPQCATSSLPKGINSAQGFAEWWQVWPTGPRKAAKQQCLDKWARYSCALNAAHILAYTEWMKVQPDWLKDNGAFICAPVVFLNKRGWLEWVEPKKAPPKHDILKELTEHKGAQMPETVRAYRDSLKRRAV